MVLTKIIGWLIFSIGLAIIIWTLFTSYNIFTKQTVVPQVFEMELESMVSEQLKGLLPTDFLPELLNLMSWSILAGILIFGGSQISYLGIKLIKR